MKLLLPILLSSIIAQASLIDKIAAVIDKKSITLSQVQRVKKNFKARNMIAPLIYQQGKNNQNDIIKTIIQTHLVRKKLKELGISVDNSIVTKRINEIRSSQKVTEKFLYNYLAKQGLSKQEYFQLIKEMMEISYFNQKIIAPLISVKNSEVDEKRTEINKKIPKMMIYNVTSYSFNPEIQKKYSNNELLKILKEFRKNPNSLPQDLQGLSGTDISLNGFELNPEVKKVLVSTRSKRFSKPKILNNNLSIFYVRSKQIDRKRTPKINDQMVKQEIAISKSTEQIQKWVDTEIEDSHVQIFI